MNPPSCCFDSSGQCIGKASRPSSTHEECSASSMPSNTNNWAVYSRRLLKWANLRSGFSREAKLDPGCPSLNAAEVPATRMTGISENETGYPTLSRRPLPEEGAGHEISPAKLENDRWLPALDAVVHRIGSCATHHVRAAPDALPGHSSGSTTGHWSTWSFAPLLVAPLALVGALFVRERWVADGIGYATALKPQAADQTSP